MARKMSSDPGSSFSSENSLSSTPPASSSPLLKHVSSHDGPSPRTRSQNSRPLLRPPRSLLSPVPPSSKSLSPDTKQQVVNSKSSIASNGQFPFLVVAASGAAVLLFLMTLAWICCARKQKKKKKKKEKKKKKQTHNLYYADTTTYTDSGFYTNAPASKWQDEENVVDVQSPPGALHGGGGGGGGGGWHEHSPNRKSSVEMSTGYSGPLPNPLPPPSPTLALGLNESTFTYEELALATNGFSPANLLGQGGFGYVHKGVLPNGKEVAVKQLKAGSGQGEREFHAEVDIISRVQHRHLVSLIGYCIAGSQRLLVYDFVPNKTLEYHLHAKGLPVMDWSRKLKIALGSAKGLAYLHEECHPKIIHRDIKSANILLDSKSEAMVADFGLAKLSLDNFTHVSTRVMGTFGYLAPEYASSGKLTEKSDVFSYGVMLLELITGKRPVDTHSFAEDSLVDWARPLLSCSLTDGDYDALSDPRLDGNYDPMEMARMVACAAASVRHSAKKRPKMSQIVRALEGEVSLEDLNEGVRPGESMLFAANSDYDPHSYNSCMNRIRKVVLTPEYSGEFTEYDSHDSASDSDGFAEDPVGSHQRHQ